MNDEKKKKLRHQGFWNTPQVRIPGDPNIHHNKWNPYEGGKEEIEYD